MSNHVGRGRGRGANRHGHQAVDPSSAAGVRGTAVAAPTSTRQVLEAAAVHVKEFVPRTSGSAPPLPATAVNAQVFRPRHAGPPPAAAAPPPVAMGNSAASTAWSVGSAQPDSYATHTANHQGHGSTSSYSNSGDTEAYDLGTTPQETDALLQVEQLINRLLTDPWSLECELDQIVLLLNRSIVSEQALYTLCHHIIQTGWLFPAFSYVGGRLVHLLDTNLSKNGVLGKFRSIFLQLLNSSFHDLGAASGEPMRRQEWLNFSIFFAEIYRNLIIIQPSSNVPSPIKALSMPLLEIVRSLMLQPGDDTMQCACNILKLTGSYLTQDAADILRQCTEGLKVLPKHELSLGTRRLIESVLRLESQNWGSSPGVVPHSPVFIPTTDPLAFAPSEPVTAPAHSVAAAATSNSHSTYPTYSQNYGSGRADPLESVTNTMASSSLQPVTNKDMWSEYADPDDEYEDDDDMALQKDMEEEYARFLRETEDS
ncbi:polyadenylate-binding protein-interacting protein 1-like [Sycon ciliatum]|uniref:polyadenylate-binding protein-interacting protein 1-like n=1 Tax=Sycon ciliatum TaxID=27933 RepID=UPI0020AA64E7|eukprot:scpid54850/ scgid29665/ Polyadenylate-binding protein-interacting protein 1